MSRRSRGAFEGLVWAATAASSFALASAASFSSSFTELTLRAITCFHAFSTFAGGVSATSCASDCRSIAARLEAALAICDMLPVVAGTPASSRLRFIQISLACARTPEAAADADPFVDVLEPLGFAVEGPVVTLVSVELGAADSVEVVVVGEDEVVAEEGAAWLGFASPSLLLQPLATTATISASTTSQIGSDRAPLAPSSVGTKRRSPELFEGRQSTAGDSPSRPPRSQSAFLANASRCAHLG
jgi:hypothetical protein